MVRANINPSKNSILGKLPPRRNRGSSAVLHLCSCKGGKAVIAQPEGQNMDARIGVVEVRGLLGCIVITKKMGSKRRLWFEVISRRRTQGKACKPKRDHNWRTATGIVEHS